MIRIMQGLALICALAAPAMAQAISPQALNSPALGAEIWHLEENSVPMVALEIVFPGGAALDPDDRRGVAHFLSGMLDEGAGDLDSRAFNEAAELQGLRLSFDASRDAFSVSARMLSANLEQSARMINLALTQPRFGAEPLRRVRGQILSSLASQRHDPQALAARAWFAAAFPDDPYGRPVGGDEADVAAISAEDLRAALRRLTATEGAAIAVVGDIDAVGALTLAETILAGAPHDAPALPAQTRPRFAGAVLATDFDAPQSSATFGQSGPLREDPDYLPLYVLNHILGGGGFSSRLTEEVREKRGLAYSVYSYLAPYDRAGLWIGGVGAANARMAQTVALIREQWRDLAENGVTEDTLERSKKNLTGAWALRFEGNADIARFLAGAQRAGLGLDYIHKRNGLIEAITVGDIARVAKKWMTPQALTFSIAGRPEGLDAAAE